MNLIQIAHQFLALLFPPRADERVVSTISIEDFISLLEPLKSHGVTTLLPYTHRSVRSVLWEAKFHMNDRAVSLLAHALAEHIKKSGYTEYILVPIPLAPKRLRERGYNQCELIAREAVRILKSGSVSMVLEKKKETVPQTTLKRQERLTNVKGVFKVGVTAVPIDARIIIIDDVVTTGATLQEACRAFGAAGFSKVTAIALTRAG